MPKHYKQSFPVEKWREIRELLYLFILFFYTILLLHDAPRLFLHMMCTVGPALLQN